MKPALGFGRTTPATGSFIFSGGYGSCAGPAADADVPLVVEWVVGNVLTDDPLPDSSLGPVGEWRDFDHPKLFVPTHNR